MEPNSQLLFIVNPISGDSNKDTLIELVCNETQKRGFAIEVYKTTGNNDNEKIKDLISSLQPERVLVAGGDGTIVQVADLLEGKDISLAIFPAGSANGLAANLLLPDNREEQLEIALGSTLKEIDMIKINGQTSLHIADLGINAELIKNYENSKIRGKLGYLLQAVPTLFKCEYPFNFTIEANGEEFSQSGILLAIANAKKFGTGANVNPDGKMDDGLFEVLIFKKMDIVEILKTLYSDDAPNPDFVDIIKTKQATIKCSIDTALQIDGEFIGELTEVEAKIGDHKLALAVSGNK
ncbi:diacylglycerol/lipid kinase family protein [Leeuwenhoekiella sp. A16]|uniref:diacylglycerol/lipid kinase family protein n=1 Tax=unclassified Leeuwenhoekiella TaxID=2615029 RepID=UPI003A803237